MAKKYVVDLTNDERQHLLILLKKGKVAARKVPGSNGFCGHHRKPPIEEAIKKLCNQFG
jgi:hypothetical protein